MNSAALENAFPRWLIEFFSAGASSAVVIPRSGRKNSGSYPKPSFPRAPLLTNPPISPPKISSRPSGHIKAMEQTKRAERAAKMLKSGEKRFADEAALGEKLLAHLDNLQPARTCPMTDKEREIAREWFLLTTKPVIYACNIKEDDLGKDEDSLPGVADVKAIAAGENAKVLVISAKIEEDIAQMDDEEKDMFLEEMGIGKSGLDRLIAECYDLLGLISFLTAGPDECRAWTIRKGTKAPQAAGKIHSDFERGFIRAEVIAFDDLKACGTMAAAKAKGLVRSEGKEYVMKDGDIVNFLFNV